MATKVSWYGVQATFSTAYLCGYCGSQVASEKGWWAIPDNVGGGENNATARIRICHLCHEPTYFGPDGKQIPGSAFGASVEHITDKLVEDLYAEARAVTASGSYTAAVLCCRKLLMHIAVAKGAAEGLSFAAYVQDLSDKGFVPPGAKQWVDHIRDKGNEANHEIVIMTKEEAERLISFCEMLLKIIYEFPARTPKKPEK